MGLDDGVGDGHLSASLTRLTAANGTHSIFSSIG